MFVMKEVFLGTFPKENNLYIQLQPDTSNFVKPYDFIVLSYGERQIKMSMEELFNKLEEIFFKENKDE